MKKVLICMLIVGLALGFSSIGSAEVKQGDKNFVISVGYGWFSAGAKDWDGTYGLGMGFLLTDQFELNIGVSGQWNTFGDEVNLLVKPNFYMETQSKINPYIGLALGANFGGGTEFAGGAQIGMKQFISDNTFIQYELSYLRLFTDNLNSVTFSLGLGFRF
ncbi:MAG: hypothetical protein NC915_02660 [Candidatus Omnitrophica bacterium]|nr:hypothetical protein [Candidatus Omnitrophota bacterium]